VQYDKVKLYLVYNTNNSFLHNESTPATMAPRLSYAINNDEMSMGSSRSCLRQKSPLREQRGNVRIRVECNQFFPVPHLNNMTREDIENTWFDDEAYQQIKMDYQLTVFKMEAGEVLDPNENVGLNIEHRMALGRDTNIRKMLTMPFWMSKIVSGKKKRMTLKRFRKFIYGILASAQGQQQLEPKRTRKRRLQFSKAFYQRNTAPEK
jgi:hypothetical protein